MRKAYRGHGRTVDFKNAVVIMTSNIGSQYIHDLKRMDEAEMREKVMEALRIGFRPEFLNRVDEIIIFHPLEIEQLKKIVEIQVARLKKYLLDRKIDIRLTDSARAYLAKEGYDPTYGARPLKRLIQKEILNPLAMKILSGEFREGDTVEVDAEKGMLKFIKAVEAEVVT